LTKSQNEKPKFECKIKKMAISFCKMGLHDAYIVYLLNKKVEGVEIAYKAALTWYAEPNKILAQKLLEKICMSNLSGEQ
jgi:hypothetical protein